MADQPNITRSLSDMQAISIAHAFDESLKYIYTTNGIFADYDRFYPHEVHVFMRYNPAQLRSVKACQLQSRKLACRMVVAQLQNSTQRLEKSTPKAIW